MRRISLRHKLHKIAASYTSVINEILNGAAPRIEEFASGIRIAEVLNDIKKLNLSEEQAKIVLSYFNKMSNGFVDSQIALIEDVFPKLSKFVREELPNASSAEVANNALSHPGDVLPTRIAPSEISLEVYQKYLKEAANYKKLIEAIQKSPEQFRQRYLALTAEQKQYPMQLWRKFKPANMPETIEATIEGVSAGRLHIEDVEAEVVVGDILRREGFTHPEPPTGRVNPRQPDPEVTPQGTSNVIIDSATRDTGQRPVPDFDPSFNNPDGRVYSGPRGDGAGTSGQATSNARQRAPEQADAIGGGAGTSGTSTTPIDEFRNQSPADPVTAPPQSTPNTGGQTPSSTILEANNDTVQEIAGVVSPGVNSTAAIPNESTEQATQRVTQQAEAIANAVVENPQAAIANLRASGTPTDLKRIGKIIAGVAAGLTGLALFNYIASDKYDNINPSIQNGPQADSSRNELGYEQASLIMKAKGYISSIENDWTDAFDSAFRSFIDDGTRIESEAKSNAIKTNLSGGQQWADIAMSLGFEPNKKGAFAAIKIYDKYVVKKDASSKPGQSQSGSGLDKGNQDVSSDKFDILANIIGAMYNQKLVGTPGFDLIREPKRIEALVNAVGGPNPTGYANAAKEVAKRNQNILYKLPQSITGPIDKDFAKDKSNKSLLQDIQVVINDIYDSAMSGSKTLGVFNPRLEKSTELIANFLRSASAGKLIEKTAINNLQHLVKLAEIRKLKIREEIRQEMSPSEMASARRQKMREATNE